MSQDEPYPIISKLIRRAQRSSITSTWLSQEEYKALPAEIDRVMRERSALIDMAMDKIKSDQESMGLGEGAAPSRG